MAAYYTNKMKGIGGGTTPYLAPNLCHAPAAPKSPPDQQRIVISITLFCITPMYLLISVSNPRDTMAKMGRVTTYAIRAL